MDLSMIKRCLFSCLLIFMLIFMLIFPKEALSSARSGLILWYQNLVPVLFPFMILSNLMIRLDLIAPLLRFFHPIFRIIWGTSVYGSYAILAGFLFGCPIGAKILGDLRKQELIPEQEALYLITFVNNLSPAFLITFLVHENLKAPALVPPTLCILYGAPLLTSFFFLPGYRKSLHAKSPEKNKASKVPIQPELIDACIFDGIINITRLGAYIMLFALITGAFRLLPIDSALLRCALSGCLEITAGIQTVCETALSFSVKYFSLMLLCSFGGICTLAQTLSVFRMNRKIVLHYLHAKAVTMGFALLLTVLLFL